MQINKALLALAMGMALAAHARRKGWNLMRYQRDGKPVCRYYWPETP